MWKDEASEMARKKAETLYSQKKKTKQHSYVWNVSFQLWTATVHNDASQEMENSIS